MSTIDIDYDAYDAVDAKDYDDLTLEDLNIVHDAEQKTLDATEKAYNETGKVSPGYWDYIRSTITYGSVHHAALIQKKAELAALKEAGNLLRDASVAYVTELEEKVAALQAQLQESNDQ